MFATVRVLALALETQVDHEVQTVTLDTFVSLEGLDRVDFKNGYRGGTFFASRQRFYNRKIQAANGHQRVPLMG